MQLLNKTVRLMHIGNIMVPPGAAVPIPKEVSDNERMMKHIMKDVEADRVEIVEDDVAKRKNAELQTKLVESTKKDEKATADKKAT
jgi:hypothetical protein